MPSLDLEKLPVETIALIRIHLDYKGMGEWVDTRTNVYYDSDDVDHIHAILSAEYIHNFKKTM